MGESTAFRGEFGHSFYVPVIARYEAINGWPHAARYEK